MKAAILHQYGTIPKYEDFPDPVPTNENEVLVMMKASSIKNLDKLKAAGKHYTAYSQLPTTVGIDGVGILQDGRKIYAAGITGMIAEKALVQKNRWIELPGEIDFETASALPNALMGSDMALIYRCAIKKGDTILINGATGVTGKVAVQMAKYRGASKVIVTGRNKEILEELKGFGADEIISLKQNDEAFVDQLKEVHNKMPIDIVLDYLWGHPVELILHTFKTLPPRKLKIVTVGEMAGASIALASGILRSTQIELLGSGIGSIMPEEAASYMKNVLPEMFQLAAAGKLKINTEAFELKDVEAAWQKNAAPGKRIVITI